jgi:hypothetical protein
VAAGDLTLEIVEGPGAGTQLALDRGIVIGRAPDSDLVLDDGEVFVNHDELVGPARLDPGDELLVGVTVIQLRSRQNIASQQSAIRAVPPGLATAPRPPAYVNPEVIRAEAGQAPPSEGIPQLDKYLDVRVRRRAQLAPLALFVLVALALILYFALRK